MNVLDFTPDINPNIELDLVYVLDENANAHAKGIDFNALAHPTEKRIVPVYQGVEYIMMLPIGLAFMEDFKKYRLFYRFENMIEACQEALSMGIVPYVADRNGHKVDLRVFDDDVSIRKQKIDGVVITAKKAFSRALHPRNNIKPQITINIMDMRCTKLILENYVVGSEAGKEPTYGYNTSNFLELGSRVNSNFRATIDAVLDATNSISRIKKHITMQQNLHYAFNYEYADAIKELVSVELSQFTEDPVEPKKLRIFIEDFRIDIDVEFLPLEEDDI